jgi:predicted secreted acid phosphatase
MSKGNSANVLGQSKKSAPILFWIETYLRRMKNEWPTANLAIVFDIDDTILIGYPQKPDVAVWKLYKLAQKMGYSIFFVTARVLMNDNYKHTMKQLKELGFGHYNGLYLMGPEYLKEPDFSLYKYRIRQGLHDAGYNIVLNMGDTWHDLMLLTPYRGPSKQVAKISYLTSLPKRDYVIFRPPDVAWMAVKFPERPMTKAERESEED